MLQILTSTQSATTVLVDEHRRCLWFTDGRSIKSISLSDAASTTHQVTEDAVTGMEETIASWSSPMRTDAS